MSVEAWAIVASVVLAFSGYAAKYVNDLRLAQRKDESDLALAQRTDRLDRVNRQLRDLYGPLFATCAATSRLWHEFVRRHGHPGARGFWTSTEAVEAWRLWMTTVFMPLNVEMRDAVVHHSDLLRETDDMPGCLLDLCAHVAGYETVLERWRSGTFDAHAPKQNTSVVSFPDAQLRHYANVAYHELKHEQSELLTGLGVTTS